MKIKKIAAVLIGSAVIACGLVSTWKLYRPFREIIEVNQVVQEKEQAYELQHEAFGTGHANMSYKNYENLYNETRALNRLYCYLYYYNLQQEEKLTIEEVVEFTKEEYLENGEPKTYKDDPRINKYIEWWLTNDNEKDAYAFCANVADVLVQYGYYIDLKDYTEIVDDELVDSVPLKKIKDLQAAIGGDYISYENVNLYSASLETIDIAIDIFLSLEED